MKAIEVAKAFISRIPQSAIEDGEGISHLKLQKLLFLAQEHYLYKNGEVLFQEKIEAWEHGPVVREIWNEYNSFRNSPITLIYDTTIEDKEVLNTINSIWEEYGSYDAWYLRNLTHEYKIWSNNFHYEDVLHNNEITPKEILKYRQDIEIAKKEAIQQANKDYALMKDLVI